MFSRGEEFAHSLACNMGDQDPVLEAAILTAAVLGFLIGPCSGFARLFNANTMENIEEYATLKGSWSLSECFVLRHPCLSRSLIWRRGRKPSGLCRMWFPAPALRKISDPGFIPPELLPLDHGWC